MPAGADFQRHRRALAPRPTPSLSPHEISLKPVITLLHAGIFSPIPAIMTICSCYRGDADEVGDQDDGEIDAQPTAAGEEARPRLEAGCRSCRMRWFSVMRESAAALTAISMIASASAPSRLLAAEFPRSPTR